MKIIRDFFDAIDEWAVGLGVVAAEMASYWITRMPDKLMTLDELNSRSVMKLIGVKRERECLRIHLKDARGEIIVLGRPVSGEAAIWFPVVKQWIDLPVKLDYGVTILWMNQIIGDIKITMIIEELRERVP